MLVIGSGKRREYQKTDKKEGTYERTKMGAHTNHHEKKGTQQKHGAGDTSSGLKFMNGSWVMR